MSTDHDSYEAIASRRHGRAEYREGYDEGRRAFLIGQAIRERRLAPSLSRTEVAVRSDMTQPALSRLEAGGAVPTTSVLDRICAALDADLNMTIAPTQREMSESGRDARRPIGVGTSPLCRNVLLHRDDGSRDTIEEYSGEADRAARPWIWTSGPVSGRRPASSSSVSRRVACTAAPPWAAAAAHPAAAATSSCGGLTRSRRLRCGARAEPAQRRPRPDPSPASSPPAPRTRCPAPARAALRRRPATRSGPAMPPTTIRRCRSRDWPPIRRSPSPPAFPRRRRSLSRHVQLRQCDAQPFRHESHARHRLRHIAVHGIGRARVGADRATT